MKELTKFKTMSEYVACMYSAASDEDFFEAIEWSQKIIEKIVSLQKDWLDRAMEEK